MKRSISFGALIAGTIVLTSGATAAQTPYYPSGSAPQPTYPATTYGQAQYGQTPYGQAPYNQTQYGQTQPADALSAILGALFGDQFGASSSLESQWSRGRRPLNTQRAQFRSQVDAEVRRGNLSSNRAARINERYDALVQLEARYASDGRITTQERADLAERYRRLTDQLDDATGGGGNNGGGYGNSIADGRSAFEARIDAAVRDRYLSRDEGYRLRSDYQALIQLEASYSRDGLNANERADLQYRLSDLERRLGGGYGGGGGYGNQGRISSIEAGIVSAERSGVSRSETDRLRTELGDLTRLDAAYAADGLNSDESSYLTRRLGELEQRVRNARR